LTNNIFDILLLLARPAAGKSEIIQYLNNIENSDRSERFHIGDFDVIDDFPMLWTWFEEDAILTHMGHPRLHTIEGNFFIGVHLWDLLIERICLEYEKKQRDSENYHDEKTTIIEFARGTEHGGFERAFKHLNIDIVKRMAILYINVSWEESLRKNRERFNPNAPDSILEHALPDKKLEFLYRYSDWDELTKLDPHFISIQNIPVPYVIFENEDDVTSEGGSLLSMRLENTLNKLWTIYQKRKKIGKVNCIRGSF